MSVSISHEELLTRLEYNKETGHFSWKKVKSKRVKVGDRAGTEHHGYRYITLNDKSYSENRLAWFYILGEWPKGIIDHKNLDRADNRWENLWERTDSQNQHNTTAQLNNKLGFQGVIRQGKKYRARININGVRYRLGDFETPEQAATAYELARAESFGPRTYTNEDVQRAIEKRIERIKHKAGYKKREEISVKDRFYQNFKVNEQNGCWEWIASLWDAGYGKFKSKELGKRTMAASKASWFIHKGPITDRFRHVCHKCDNRLCVNPDHLFIGSIKENMEDCVAKGRINRG